MLGSLAANHREWENEPFCWAPKKWASWWVMYMEILILSFIHSLTISHQLVKFTVPFIWKCPTTNQHDYKSGVLGVIQTPNLLLQEPSNGFIFQCNFCILNLCIKPFLDLFPDIPKIRGKSSISLIKISGNRFLLFLKPEAQHWRKRPRNWSSQNKYGSLKMCLHHTVDGWNPAPPGMYKTL